MNVENINKKKVGVFVVTGIISLIIFILVASSIVRIETGSVGIKSIFGKYEEKELQPGLHFVNPFTTDVIIVDTHVHAITYKKGMHGEKDNGVIYLPDIVVRDSRGLPVSVELTVQYKLKPEFAAEMYAKWGENWEEKLINPVVRSAVRDVIGKYAAEEIPSHRSEIEQAIISRIQKEILKNSNGWVEVIGVNMRKITLPQSVMEKIQEVQKASLEAQKMKQMIVIAQRQQQAEKIQAETEKLKKVIAAQAEAQERIERAKGLAESKKLQAKAEADALLMKAEAQAKANQMIAKSLTPQLIELKRIEVMKEQAKALANNPNIKIWVGAPKEGMFVFPLK